MANEQIISILLTDVQIQHNLSTILPSIPEMQKDCGRFMFCDEKLDLSFHKKEDE